MDRMIFTGMAGANQAFDRQSTIANNLANVSTTGFRAQLNAARSVPILGDGDLKTRTSVVETTPRADFSTGTVSITGRPLDVAMKGNAWLAIQALDGTEAYTRRGDLQINNEGLVTTGTGSAVMGDGGPIQVAPGTQVFLSEDGTISGIGPGQSPDSLSRIGKLKLVNAEPTDLVRAEDGDFRAANGGELEADEDMRVSVGSLEGSNVNAVDGMVAMIAAQRMYEMQMKVVDTANENAQKANNLLSLR